MRSKIWIRRGIIAAFFMALFVTAFIIDRKISDAKKLTIDKDELKVHFIDVGQGSSVLLELNNHYALIDGGAEEAEGISVKYLSDLGVEKLDYLIATHYDIDHIYGLVEVMQKFHIETLIAPEYVADTKIYERFMDTMEQRGLSKYQPSVGEVLKFDKAELLCIAPGDPDFQVENDLSIGFKLQYKEKSFLLCGDATSRSEEEMISCGIDLKCDVYMASHHGSSSSSSAQFLEKALPEITVISCGEKNDFGHPTKKVLRRLNKIETKIYRTDLLGTIIVSTNGKNMNVTSLGKVEKEKLFKRDGGIVINSLRSNVRIMNLCYGSTSTVQLSTDGVEKLAG